jgi:hypothetical protein
MIFGTGTSDDLMGGFFTASRFQIGREPRAAEPPDEAGCRGTVPPADTTLFPRRLAATVITRREKGVAGR